MLKTLSDRTGFQIGTPRGFGVFVTGRPIVRRQTRISPAKFGDVLLADIIALKVSIVASALQKTPLGFGELIYNDGSSNPLNGLMIKEIAHVADSLMMGNYSGGIHMFASEPSYLNLDTTIQKINSAFEGPLDTVKFSDSLRFMGVRPLADVPFLRSNSSMQPERIQPVQVLNLDALVDSGTISPEDRNLFCFVDTPEEGFEMLKDGLTKYHLQAQQVRPQEPEPEKEEAKDHTEFPEIAKTRG